MLLRIARKELSEVRRDRYAVCVLGVYVALLAISCVAYTFGWMRQITNQSTLQHEAREAWLTQTSKSPHQATHHGTTVHKFPSPLGNFDPGVAPVVGTLVKIESHKRHEATNSVDEDRLSILQLDFTTPALLMQVVLPLVVIVLSHGIVSKERELGTIGLLASLRVSQWQIITGKLTSLFLITILTSVPVLICLLWSAANWPAESGMTRLDVLIRAIAIYAVNLAYLAMWCAAGISVSTRFSSGTSLVILIFCWSAWTIVIPRLAVDLAHSRFPLPSQQSLLEAREKALQMGANGQSTLEEYNAALEERLMKKYGMTELEDLPIDLNAARLLSMEEFTNSIDDEAQSQLERIYQEQNRFVESLIVVSPYLAMRSVSSSFAGTDRHHHNAFLNSAEKYRRSLVKIMNTAEMMGERPGSTSESARKFWNKVPEFRQGYPTLIDVSYAMRWQIGLLSLWLALFLFFAMLSSKQTIA